jgi:2-polyprenyl-3-methyl-5-hydroxy-6-metoxy-1,4-benzoquinol methylase/glycosyltransferase involved in cell wall biosynthesis
MPANAEKFPISVIILTLDEAENIGPCIQCLDWADEVILLDSGSNDDTVERARQARADMRIFTNPFEDFGQQRNWALDQTHPKYEWIFFVDADERITPRCAEAIKQAVTNPGAHDGFFVCYRNIFLGRWIKHCKMFPTWQLRILRLGRVRYRKEGHGQREVMSGSAGYIHEPFDHLDLSKGLAQWIDRHNDYSTNEVELIRRLQSEPLNLRELFGDPVRRRRCLKRLGARLGASPSAWFVYLYIIHGGFLDGKAGLMFCLLRLAQQIHIKAKLFEALQAERAQQRGRPPGEAQAAPESAVEFHERLAKAWEAKYDKHSFGARVGVLEECINGVDLRGQQWLDAGCGTATLGRYVAQRGCHLLCVDASPSMLRIASEIASRDGLAHALTFQHIDDLQTMPMNPGSFDGVLCNSVLEYLPDPKSVLARMAHSLKPGGIMVISVPNRSSLLRQFLSGVYRFTHWLTRRGWPSYMQFSRHAYRRDEFAAMMESQGMQVEKVISYGGPLPRFLQRWQRMGPLNMYTARRRT